MLPRSDPTPAAKDFALKLGIASLAEADDCGPTWSEKAGGPGGRASKNEPSGAEIPVAAIEVPVASTTDTCAPPSGTVPFTLSFTRTPRTWAREVAVGSRRSNDVLLACRGPNCSTGRFAGATRTWYVEAGSVVVYVPPESLCVEVL